MADNILVMNQGSDPLVNFNFMLRVELAFDLPCKSVRAFSRELEYDMIQEGGLNDYVHMRRKPITKPFTLEIERYVGVDYFDPMPLGAELVLPVLLFVSRTPGNFIPGVVARTYIFTGCSVMKKTYGDLVGDQPGILVETTTLNYREFVVVDIPWSSVGDNIMAGGPNLSTRAATMDKTAQDMKDSGQSYYNMALEAKNKADEEYSEEALEALLAQLRDAANYLKGAAGEGGSLATRLEAARKAMMESDGRPLQELAAEAAKKAQEKEREARKAEQALTEKQSAYQALAQQEEAAQKDLEQAQQRIQELEEQLRGSREERDALREALPGNVRTLFAAMEAQSNAQSAYDDARRDVSKAQQAYDDARRKLEEELATAAEKTQSIRDEISALEASGQAVDEALTQSLQEAVEAEQQLRQAIDAPQEGDELAQLQAELADANELLNTAQEDFNTAQGYVRDNERLESLDREIRNMEEDLTQAQQDRDEASEKLEPAAQRSAEARADMEQAQTAYDQAREAWQTAQASADRAQQRADTAAANLTQAKEKYDLANKNLRPIQNCLTNLENRKAKVGAAQENCTAQHDECKAANDELQGMPDEPIAEVNTQHEKVKRLAKQAMFHEREVRDTVQYMQNSQETLDRAAPALSEN